VLNPKKTSVAKIYVIALSNTPIVVYFDIVSGKAMSKGRITELRIAAKIIKKSQYIL